ncbi:hypothetical protein ZIOFF_014677 [Zingiber officinale]|uniref:Uncharacterized protein n=1 Tax=Zingiber officinale TaxID=94328 RepID=A0A8J5HQC8_ZINOF|nr:hypothetical protein ZIOFF_014677 [Zingiber officinale]
MSVETPQKRISAETPQKSISTETFLPLPAPNLLRDLASSATPTSDLASSSTPDMGKSEEVLKAANIDEEAEGANSHIVPLTWVGFSFVIGFVKAVRKFTSPRAQHKRLVNKNAFLLKSIDKLFLKGRNEVNNAVL